MNVKVTRLVWQMIVAVRLSSVHELHTYLMSNVWAISCGTQHTTPHRVNPYSCKAFACDTYNTHTHTPIILYIAFVCTIRFVYPCVFRDWTAYACVFFRHFRQNRILFYLIIAYLSLVNKTLCENSIVAHNFIDWFLFAFRELFLNWFIR